MIRISQLKLPAGHSKTELYHKAAKALHIKSEQIASLQIRRQSIDARKKPDIFLIYVVDITLNGISEQNCVSRSKNKDVSIVTERPYQFPKPGTKALRRRPVIIGSGPAGLFCCYMLAQNGYRPILLERGKDVEARKKDVEAFWNGGPLNPESNVSFGEGGAGTFSDGKLNTGTKDERIFFVLQTLCEHGAPEDILFDAKPHVGTDKLPQTVRAIREEIKSLGGEVRFNTQMTDLLVKNNAVCGVVAETNGVNETIETAHVILAIGHSARDTFKMLFEKSCVPMEPKPFSVGARIEHRAETIDRAQYGDFAGDPALGAADYKLNVHLENGRGVYTFCMCPGGYVVGAASETGSVVTNGMSEYARDGQNSNAALLVGITPEDFGSAHPLAGIAFQRKIERAAFEAGGGAYSAPCQRVGDLLENRATTALNGSVQPTYRPGVVPGDLRTVLPDYICDSMAEGIRRMGRRLRGFDDPDALLTAPETRSSSPVRILRNETRECPTVRGLFPCGEGAGYAGGITSAAVDGLRCAECVIKALQNEA